MEKREHWDEDGVRMGLESCTGDDCGRGMYVVDDLGVGVLPYALNAWKSKAGCSEKPLLSFLIGHEPPP